MSKAKQQLKAKAHRLKPIVMIGSQGLTPAVHKEIARALDDHELIKIRISTEDRAEKQRIYQEICHKNDANPVQLIGHIAVVFRKNKST